MKNKRPLWYYLLPLVSLVLVLVVKEATMLYWGLCLLKSGQGPICACWWGKAASIASIPPLPYRTRQRSPFHSLRADNGTRPASAWRTACCISSMR